MRNRILQTLMVACSLTLALPQGWCCLIAVQIKEKVATGEEPTCSMFGTPGCCCPTRPSKPNKSPAPVERCPCTDRNATVTTNSVEKADVDLGVVAILPEIDLQFHEVRAVAHVGCSAHAPPRSLHVLHCRWLI